MSLRVSLGIPDADIHNQHEPDSNPKPGKILGILYIACWLIHIVYWLVVGLFLSYFPLTYFWSNNELLFRHAGLRSFMIHPFVKSSVFVLGMVNILIGIWEFAQFWKNARRLLSR